MNNKLIVYFSASGTTKIVSEKLSNIIGADLFEIVPKEKYTNADLDWTNKESRSSVEMQDKNSRPEILNKLDNIDKYDTIILGFPVWWYTAPTIINTFIEDNDLTNKKIYIFVTSGGSSSEGSYNDLKNKYIDLDFVSHKRLNTNLNIDEIKGWIE